MKKAQKSGKKRSRANKAKTNRQGKHEKKRASKVEDGFFPHNSLLPLSEGLNPNALEYEAYRILRKIWERTRIRVKHNGTMKRHAPGNVADVEVDSDDYKILVEITKLRGAAQAKNEATPVSEHLREAKKKNPGKLVFCLFISPETSHRSIRHFHAYNYAQRNKKDQKIAFLSFDAFNVFAEEMLCRDITESSIIDFAKMLENLSLESSDIDATETLNSSFLQRVDITRQLEMVKAAASASHKTMLNSLFRRIHNDLRSVCGLNPAEAFHELSKLIFLKMYEENRVRQARANGRLTMNRFSTRYIAEERQRNPESAEHPIRILFEKIKEPYIAEQLFDDTESVKIDGNENYLDGLVGLMENVDFIGKLDIKGIIYEQFLGLSLKNTSLGQYFTPEPVIDFIVLAAEPGPGDRVIDPACGTGRFLVRSMEHMLEKAANDSQERHIKESQIWGVEKSPYVSKIARMNMYLHGDGRANVYRADSFIYHVKEEERFSLILTNPPLGDINFKQIFGEFEQNPAIYASYPFINVESSTSRAGEIKRKVTRNEAKGGALFLCRFLDFIGEGGRVFTIMDDGVLNTDDHRQLRDYIKRRYYIIAVISLTPAAFAFASETTTKTSILILEKKEEMGDGSFAMQDFPVFFAHADYLAVDTKGKPCPNDLVDAARDTDILREYYKYRNTCCRAKKARKEKSARQTYHYKGIRFKRHSGEMHHPSGYLNCFSIPFDQIEDRLEFKWYDRCLQSAMRQINSWENYVQFGDIVDKSKTDYGITATGKPAGKYPFINIEQLSRSGRVTYAGVRYLDGVSKTQCILREGDMLISRSRLVGLSSVVREMPSAETVYGSYIIRFRLGNLEYIPEYVALLFNSFWGQVQVYRLKSGGSGYNINADQLYQVRIPLIPLESQNIIISMSDPAALLGQSLADLQGHLNLLDRFQRASDFLSAPYNSDQAAWYEELSAMVSALKVHIESSPMLGVESEWIEVSRHIDQLKERKTRSR